MNVCSFFPLLFLFFSLFFSSMSIARVDQKDPFEKIITGKLENGINYFVVSSHNSKLTTLEFHVKTGHDAERPKEYGLAHLVEHLVFRDNELADNMSYLQVFKDKGGRVNAHVTSRATKYKVTIPSQHSMWALKLLTKMLQDRKFTRSELKKARRSVMIEIGEPSPLEKFLRFSPIGAFWELFFYKGPTFLKNEFKVDFDKYDRPYYADRINNSSLSLDQAQEFYESFYIPKNIKLFVAGNFNQRYVISYVERKWKNYRKGVTGRELPQRDEPQLVDRPFYSIGHSTYPSMELGVKVANISLKDLFILSSYTEFIAEEIMKGVRNKKGETYTAHGGVNLYKRHGSIYVRMDSTSESFARNFRNLKNLLLEKPQKEDVSKAEFEKAKLYLKHKFESSYEEDAKSLLSNLYVQERYARVYGLTGSPIRLVNNLSFDEYSKVLKQYIMPKRYTIKKYQRHILFYYESFLIKLISFILFILLARKILKTSFDHFKIRFVKKIKIPPLKICEIGIIVVSIFLSYGFCVIMDEYVFYNNRLFNSNLVTGAYLPWVIYIGVIVGIVVSLFSIFPRKIYLTDDFLYIKSMTYRMKKISALDIEKFESIKLWKVFFSLNLLFKINYRFYVYRSTIWKSVLLVHLKNGRLILFDCGLTSSIYKGLNDWLDASKDREEKRQETEVDYLIDRFERVGKIRRKAE